MLKKYLHLYMKFIAQYLKSLMEYKADFLVGLVGFLITQAAGITFIYLIFQRIPHLNGWSFDQILFIYGFAQLPRGIDHLLTDNLWALSGRIVIRGEFDRYLLRPINPLFHLISERLQPDAFGELLVGIILVATAVIRLKLTFGFLDVLMFIATVICGAIIYLSIKLLLASIAFWVKFSQAILYVIYMVSDFAKYPMGIYARGIRVILTFIVPFAFTAFFPAGYFVQKVNMFTAIGGTIIAAVVCFAAAYLTWLRGIAVYESAGS